MVTEKKGNLIVSSYKKFEFASLRNSHLKDGFWGKRIENYKEIIENMLEALLDDGNAACLSNFAVAAGLQEGSFHGEHWSDGDCYKFLEGCMYVYQATGDENVKAVVDKYIPWIQGAQEEDGYLSTQITLRDEVGRWERVGFHELYNMGHFFTLASTHYDVTSETVLLNMATKLADYVYTVFEGYPPELGMFGFNPSNIMGLCELYHQTGDEKYYKLAEIFVNMRGSVEGKGTDQNQTRTPLRKETQAIGHAVTSTYLYAGATDVYSRTGEQELFDALRRIWVDMTTKRTYVTGASSPIFIGFSDNGDRVHEAHGTQFDLPNKIAYNESCANIGNAMWALRMLSVTENVEYGDFAERVMYNSGISGSNLALTRYFYSNPLSYRKDTPIAQNVMQYQYKSSRRWKTYGCWCCPPQLFRTMTGVARWVYGASDDALFVNMFTSCDYTTEDLDISMTTSYPWDETVVLDVKKATAQKLKIRIPKWCKNPTVNGVAVESGKYFEITVNSGDKVEVFLPMVPVILQANPNIEADRGMVCVMYGPVVYCAEGVDNEEKLDNIYIDVKGEISAAYKKDLLNGVVTLAVPAKVRTEKAELYYEVLDDEKDTVLNMIPYYTWANREESDMSIWFPRA